MTPTKHRLSAELQKVAKIAGATNAAVYRELAERAATGEFDDYGDVHVCGPTALHNILRANGLHKFADRVANGEFDATADESEAWARSQNDPEIIAIMDAMGIGPDRSKDQ